MPRERPILFSAPMVRAILDGRKTVTRRALQPQPPEWATFCQMPEMLNTLGQWVPSGLWRWSEEEQAPLRPLRQWPVDKEGEHYWMRLKYAPGDRLWVREAWAPKSIGGAQIDTVYFRATPDDVLFNKRDGSWEPQPRTRLVAAPTTWRPSIHMPRWASRITLEVTGVKVERLQDIGDGDAIAEGVGPLCHPLGRTDLQWVGTPDVCKAPARAFADLWNSINDKRPGCSWEANPWVVAIAFKRVTP